MPPWPVWKPWCRARSMVATRLQKLHRGDFMTYCINAFLTLLWNICVLDGGSCLLHQRLPCKIFAGPAGSENHRSPYGWMHGRGCSLSSDLLTLGALTISMLFLLELWLTMHMQCRLEGLGTWISWTDLAIPGVYMQYLDSRHLEGARRLMLHNRASRDLVSSQVPLSLIVPWTGLLWIVLLAGHRFQFDASC